MALPAIIGAVAAQGGIRAALGAAGRKLGSWLFGTKLRTALTAFTAGNLLSGGGSSADTSAAAVQARNYRA